jgi:hypothetical protein
MPKLRLVVVDVHFDLIAFGLARAEHAGRVEAPRHLSVWCNGNYAAVAMDGRKLLLNYLVSGLL